MFSFRRIALAIAALLVSTQAQAACYIWSLTTSANGTADSTINWSTGMAPSAVSASGRSMMARLAECRDDLAGKLLTGGTSTAYTLTTNQVFDTLAHLDGARLCFRPHATNGTPATLAVDGLAAKPLRASPGVEIAAGTTILGAPYCVYYNNSNAEFYLNDFYPLSIGPLTITGSMIQNSTITYGKIQNETTNTLLGNVSGAPAAPEEITIGAGLTVSGTTLSAPAFPVAGTFKNLSIKVASNTTVAVAADFVAMTDGTNYKTLACSGTTNLGTTGANALDAGTIATDTWYAEWCIAKADGTVATLASTSFTAPTMPSGYTYKARIGAVQTINASATLYGTWQFGNSAQYVLGLAQTTVVPVVASGVAGTYSTTAPVWATASVSRFVPPTASKINIIAFGTYKAGATAAVIAAPNTSYGGRSDSNGNAPPFSLETLGMNLTGSMLLESTNIAWSSSAAGGAILVLGWEDNLN